MAKGVIAIDGDTSKALAAVQALKDRLGSVDEVIKKVSQTAKESGKAYDQLGADAQRVFSQTRTAAERYEATLAKLNRMLQQGKLDQDTYNRAVAQATASMESAGRAGQDAFGPKALDMVKGLVGAFGVGAGLAGAIGMAKRELEAYIEVQRRAAQTSLTEAGAQREAFINVGATTDKDREAFTKRIGDLSAKTGVSRRDLYLRASAAMSSRGSLSTDDAFKSVEAAAMLLPGNTQAGITAAGSALDITRNQGGSIEGNMGLLAAIGRMSRVTDPQKVASALPPTILAGMQRGMSAGDSGALWASITTGIGGDTSHELARAALLRLHGEMEKFLPAETTYGTEADPLAKRRFDESARLRRQAMETQLDRAVLEDPEYRAGVLDLESRERPLRRHGRPRPEDEMLRQQLAQERQELSQRVRGRLSTSGPLGASLASLDAGLIAEEAALPRKVDTAGTGLTTSLQRLEYLQKNPAAAAKFLAGAELGEAAARPAVVDLLNPKGSVARAFAQFRRDMPANDKAEAEFRTMVGVMDRDPLQQTAAFARTVGTTRENLQTANQPGARMSIVRENLAPMLQEAGLGYWATRLKGMSVELGGTDQAIPSFLNEARGAERRLRRPMEYVSGGAATEGGMVLQERKPNEIEVKQAETLNKMVHLLEQILEKTPRGNPTLARPNEDR